MRRKALRHRQPVHAGQHGACRRSTHSAAAVPSPRAAGSDQGATTARSADTATAPAPAGRPARHAGARRPTGFPHRDRPAPPGDAAPARPARCRMLVDSSTRWSLPQWRRSARGANKPTKPRLAVVTAEGVAAARTRKMPVRSRATFTPSARARASQANITLSGRAIAKATAPAAASVSIAGAQDNASDSLRISHNNMPRMFLSGPGVSISAPQPEPSNTPVSSKRVGASRPPSSGPDLRLRRPGANSSTVKSGAPHQQCERGPQRPCSLSARQLRRRAGTLQRYRGRHRHGRC